MEVIRRELHNEVRIIGFINTIELEGVSLRYGIIVAEARLKPLFHSSGKSTRKLAARTFNQSQYLKALAAGLRVGICDEWKRGLKRD